MNRFLIGLIGVFFAMYLYFKPTPSPARIPASVPLVAALAEAQDPCSGKERCAIVYMAPWCGVCKSETPQFQALAARWKKTENRALKVIVGSGSADEKLAMAKDFGEHGFVDERDEFAKIMRVQHYPTVWIVDAQGAVLHVDRAAFHWINEDSRKN